MKRCTDPPIGIRCSGVRPWPLQRNPAPGFFRNTRDGRFLLLPSVSRSPLPVFHRTESRVTRGESQSYMDRLGNTPSMTPDMPGPSAPQDRFNGLTLKTAHRVSSGKLERNARNGARDAAHGTGPTPDVRFHGVAPDSDCSRRFFLFCHHHRSATMRMPVPSVHSPGI